MLKLSLPFLHTLSIEGAPPARVYALLADIPDSLAHFPQLSALEQEADESWTWRMGKIGLGKVFVQINYGVTYVHDPEKHSISWTPVQRGNAQVSGTWTLRPEGGGTRLTLSNQLEGELKGVPNLLRRVIEPLAILENKRLIRSYMQNLKTTLEGGDGRLRPRWEISPR